MDSTPRRVDHRDSHPSWLSLSLRDKLITILVPLRLFGAWQDRQQRRNYSDVAQRVAAYTAWTCTVCGSEATGKRCYTCGHER